MTCFPSKGSNDENDEIQMYQEYDARNMIARVYLGKANFDLTIKIWD